MRRGGGKLKGAAFEREVCRRLSLWLTGGKREDTLWRSAMSGGRATIGHAKGMKLTAQAGDVSAVSPEGHLLTDRFNIELKAYRNLDFEGLLTMKGKFIDFWSRTCHEAKIHKKLPLFIAKQNRYPIMACTNNLGIHLLKCEKIILMEVPPLDLNIINFSTLISSNVTTERLVHYDVGNALKAFRAHKSRAARNGIEFEFSFDVWVEWWEVMLGPKWQTKRGRTRNKFVMGRKKDQGPYAPGNVECITQQQNARDRGTHSTAAKGTTIGTNKLTEAQVIDIYYDERSSTTIATEYGIDRTNVWLIKRKKSWQWLVENLPRKRRIRLT